MPISRLIAFNTIKIIYILELMQLIYFEIIDDRMDTSLKQNETLDIGGWMSQIIWIHQTRTL